jgi:CarboxypepD_reg-like domain
MRRARQELIVARQRRRNRESARLRTIESRVFAKVVFMRFVVAAILFSIGTLLHAAELRGKVTNAVDGEPLGQINVSVLERKLATITAADGTFLIANLPPGNYTLRLNAVGFRLLTESFTIITSEDVHEVNVVMVPDNFRRTDVVDVKADVFQAGDSPAVVEENLSSSEIRQASTVLADDPFRAVQALPGVSASGNNELLADFTVMGAPFSEVGIYLDDVLVPSPFHNGSNVTNGASLSLLTSEIVDQMRLLPVAYPERYGDQVGAALDIHTRDGSTTGPLFRASVGLGDSNIVGEGRLGDAKRGSWLGAFRRSYLGYLTRNLIRSDFADITFYDGSLKLTYDLTPQHTVTFFGLGGNTLVSDPSATDNSDVRRATSDFIFLRAGWRWSVSPHLLVDNRLAYIRQPGLETNPAGQVLDRTSYGEWAGGTNVIWAWSKNSTLEGGWNLRRLADHVSNLEPGAMPLIYQSDQRALRVDGFVQEASSFLSNRLHVLGGVRIDSREDLGVHPFSAQGSAAWRVARATELQLSLGRYAQLEFPDFQFGQGTPCPFVEQMYEKSDHYSVGIEQRMGENTQVRVQFFDRQTSKFVTNLGNAACLIQPGTFNTAQRYSRGVQIVLQRRSANRLSGWIGYTYARARENALFTASPQSVVYSSYFDSTTDQPNSVNAFATYRLRPTVNMAAKALFGTGFPAVTGLERTPSGGVAPLPVQRLPNYFRADFRTDKDWAFRRWKMTLYGEVINLTNHNNRILNFVDVTPGGQQVVHTLGALPITPTVGLVFEF